MGDLCSSCGSPAHDSDDCDARQPRDRKSEEIDRLTRQLAGAVDLLREAQALFRDAATKPADKAWSDRLGEWWGRADAATGGQ